MDSTLRPAALPPTLKELQATEEAMATLKQELATAVAVRDKLAIEVRQKDADLERCAPAVHTGLWHKAPPPPSCWMSLSQQRCCCHHQQRLCEFAVVW